MGICHVGLGSPANLGCRPHGHHAGWAVVEASSKDAVLSDLAPQFRAHARVNEIETVQF